MLTLVNTNRMLPPIGPLGLEYVAGAARRAGLDVEIVDLCLADDADAALASHFAGRRCDLVGLSFRNVDDCFWPSARWFLPRLTADIKAIRRLTDAPIVLGGVGFSIFAEAIVERAGAEFGIRGDGEGAIVELVRELRGRRRFDLVPGLIWRAGGPRASEGRLWANPPAWPAPLTLPAARDAIDNAAYYRRGGQGGFETKRGCPRRCIYCADPLAKGFHTRPRPPAEVADEVQSLLAQGVDVLHTCDSEFNVPVEHAAAVCDELIRRGLGQRVRWYAYLAVVPFDGDLAAKMRRAGCVGINFTGDSGSPEVLRTYAQQHTPDDLATAVDLCRRNGITAMVDLLLGGPGESERTLRQTIDLLKHIGPDCVGAALGMRLYPGTPAIPILTGGGPPDGLADVPGLRRRYDGPVDLLQPTFYVSPALGPDPARLVKDLIAGDQRFFEPMEEVAAAPVAGPAERAPLPVPPGTSHKPPSCSGDHNYSDNEPLCRAIAAGARGAYWDILRRTRTGA